MPELKALAFTSEIDFETFPHGTKQDLALGLLKTGAQRDLLSKLLSECRLQRPQLDWPNPSQDELASLKRDAFGRSPPFMAADPPADFVSRPVEIEQLIESLLTPKAGQSAAASITILQGAPGFGKTTLALAICHDERIRDTFPDGILWVTIGENPSDSRLIGLVEDLIYALAGLRPGSADLNSAASELARYLGDKACLLVVDDVWQETHLSPFLRGGPNCVRLVTTRYRTLLSREASGLDVGEMGLDEATQLLTAGLPEVSSHSTALKTLAIGLGSWPILLKLVNAVLRDRVNKAHQSLAIAISTVERDLKNFGITWFDAKEIDASDQDQRRQAVDATLKASIERLNREARYGRLTVDEYAFYQSLAIFPEDAAISIDTLARYGAHTNDQDSADPSIFQMMCERLYNLSLLLSYDRHTIQLHDVIHRYLVDENDKWLAELHGRLLDALAPGGWSDLPADEPYLWRNLAYHLVGAKRTDELRDLLLNFDYLQAKLAATDVNALLADFDYSPDDPLVSYVQRAIRLSAHALAVDKSQLAGQLLGRLRQDKMQDLVPLLKQAGQSKSHPWLRPLSPCLLPPDTPLLRTFSGHSGEVRALAVTSDGRYAVSASEDATLKVWDLAEEMEVHTLSGHEGPVNDVALTPDDRLAVSASEDGTLKVWQITDGSLLKTISFNDYPVNVIAIAPDGQRVVSGDEDSLIVWDLERGETLVTIGTYSKQIRDLTIRPDGNSVFGASIDDYLYEWDLASGRILYSLSYGTDSWPTVVEIASDGRLLVGGAEDGTLKLWNLTDYWRGTMLIGHTDRTVRAVAFTGDGRRLVSAEKGEPLKVWHLDHFEEPYRRPEFHQMPSDRDIRALTALPYGHFALSGSFEGLVQLWDLDYLGDWGDLRGNVTIIQLLSDGARVVLGTSTGNLRLHDLSSGRLISSTKASKTSIESIVVTPGSKYILARSRTDYRGMYDVDGKLIAWDLTSGQQRSLAKLASVAALMPDGKQAIIKTKNRKLKLWDLSTGEKIKKLDVLPDEAIIPEPGLSFGPVSVDDNGVLAVTDPNSGQVIARFTGDSTIRRFAASADGASIVASSTLGQVYFLKLENP